MINNNSNNNSNNKIIRPLGARSVYRNRAAPTRQSKPSFAYYMYIYIYIYIYIRIKL